MLLWRTSVTRARAGRVGVACHCRQAQVRALQLQRTYRERRADWMAADLWRAVDGERLQREEQTARREVEAEWAQDCFACHYGSECGAVIVK